MAQTGYTPILVYGSGTTTNVPSASNLTNSSLGSELALNYADGKLFYKDASNVVQVLASTATTAGTFTTITLSGGTANGVAYLNGSKVVTTGSALVFDGTNLGVGVTPSAWVAGTKALQVGTASLYNFASNNNFFSSNAYYNGTAWTYIQSTLAAQYQLNGSTHNWYTAPTGTAGNAITFTQAMTLTANGGLLIGKTTGSTYLNVAASFEYLQTNFTAGAGNYGYLALSQVPSSNLILVDLTNNANSNLNASYLIIVNTRNTTFGGGNSVIVISSSQNTTGTTGEINSTTFAISGTGTALSLRASATVVGGGAASIQFSARIIQI
jgi:hypothetical protein